MGFGEIYVVRAALSPPPGLSQRCVNSDPTMLGKGQLSLLGSIRSEENTEREGKSGAGLENMFPIDPRQAALASAYNACTAGIVTLHFPSLALPSGQSRPARS